MNAGVSSERTHVSVVVPVFNGAETLSTLVQGIHDALEDTTYEIVLVDDASSDDSWERICALATTSPLIRGLGLMRNYGQHNALLAGIEAAAGAVIVTMDDDLQHPPGQIPRLLAAVEAGYDVAYGKPLQRRHGARRDFGTSLAKFTLRIAMGKIAYDVSAFRAFRSDLRAGFPIVEGPSVSIDLLLSWAARRYVVVEVEHRERVAGQSSYTLRRLAAHALTMLTGFSTTPLRAASVLGLASTGLGMVLLAYVVIRYIADGSTVPGFTFLASMIALFSGVQLLTLGVIGEYLARVHERVVRRPPYVIRERANESSGE